MGVAKHRNEFAKITVLFEARGDGGLRAWSDEVPGFVLSHPNPDAVLSDVEPALEAMLSDHYGRPIRVEKLGDFDAFVKHKPNPEPAPPRKREYVTQRAA